MSLRLVKFLIVLMLISVMSSPNILGEVRINEFLANPSGDLESEWIELYFGADTTIDLSKYAIGDNLGWANISDTGIFISGSAYIIVAQNKSSFLNYYYDFEGIVIEPEGWKILNNSGGDKIRLGIIDSPPLDSFYYEEVFPENRSWERYVDAMGESYWGQSYDKTGSSPGRANSFVPFRPDGIEIEITPDPFSPNGDGFEDNAFITYDIPPGSSFDLFIYDISGRKLRTLFESSETIPGEIEWDGTDDNNQMLAVGIYILYARIQGDEDHEQKRTIVIVP
ncbi:MAG: gliding motility-associated C-terminal domain-containing protein [Candidatus Zixiibacteriota bacterium]